MTCVTARERHLNREFGARARAVLAARPREVFALCRVLFVLACSHCRQCGSKDDLPVWLSRTTIAGL